MSIEKSPLYVPADIPKFDGASEIISAFSSEFLYENMGSEKLTQVPQKLYDVVDWDGEKVPKFGKIIDWFKSNIPFEKLVNVKVVSPTSTIVEHVDFAMPNEGIELYKHSRLLEPCGYRLVLRGSRKGNLYIRDSRGEKVFVELPEETDTYLISHTQTIHCLETADENRFVVFFQGWMNPDKHRAIVARSLEKYSGFAVY